MDLETARQIAELFSRAEKLYLRVHSISQPELKPGMWQVYLWSENHSPLRHVKERHMGLGTGPSLTEAFEAAFTAAEEDRKRIVAWWSGERERQLAPAVRIARPVGTSAPSAPAEIGQISLASLGLLK